MRPLKLAALSAVLMAILLLMVAGTFVGVRHLMLALGMDEHNSKGVGALLAAVGGLGWFVLCTWSFIEAARRIRD